MKFKIWSVFFTVVFLFTTIFLGSLQAKDINIQFRTMEHGKSASVEQEIVDMFGKSRPDIKVDLLQGQWTQYYSQLRLAVMGGNPPQLGVTLLQKIVEIDEYLTPLDQSPVGNLLEMAGINPAEFDQKGWKAGQLRRFSLGKRSSRIISARLWRVRNKGSSLQPWSITRSRRL